MDGGLLLHSEALGLEVRLEAGEVLRFHDPATGQDLLGFEETQSAYRETRVRLEKEIAIREARIAELEARLGKSP